MCLSGNEIRACPQCGGRLIRGPDKDSLDLVCVYGCKQRARTRPVRHCQHCNRPLTLEMEYDLLENPSGVCYDCQAEEALAGSVHDADGVAV